MPVKITRSNSSYTFTPPIGSNSPANLNNPYSTGPLVQTGPDGFRLLICGDRNWNDRDFILRKLRALNPSPVIIIHGDARGADKLAQWAADELGIPTVAVPAQWDTYGKRAGPVRNEMMLSREKPTEIWVFHDDFAASRGSKSMVNIANRANPHLPIKFWSHADEDAEAGVDEGGKEILTSKVRNQMGFDVLKSVRVSDGIAGDAVWYKQRGDTIVFAIYDDEENDIVLYDCHIRRSKKYTEKEIEDMKLPE